MAQILISANQMRLEYGREIYFFVNHAKLYYEKRRIRQKNYCSAT